MNKGKINKLHKLLVQTTIDFCINNDINDIHAIEFNVDALEDGIKYKVWTPSMDSYLGIYDNKNNLIQESL